jgi:hypothetical protein
MRVNHHFLLFGALARPLISLLMSNYPTSADNIHSSPKIGRISLLASCLEVESIKKIKRVKNKPFMTLLRIHVPTFEEMLLLACRS